MKEPHRFDLDAEHLSVFSKAGQLIRKFQIAFWSWDLLTDRIAFSSAVEEKYGLSFRELWTERVLPAEPETDEFRLSGPDRSVRWVRQHLIPHLDEHNRVTQLDGWIVDITELKQAEIEAEAFFRSFIHSSPNPCYAIGLDGTFIEVNEATAKLTGYSKSELLRMTYAQLLPPEDRDQSAGVFDNVKTNGLSVTVPLSIVHKSGRRISLDNTLVPRMRRGQVESLYGTAKKRNRTMLLDKPFLESVFRFTDARNRFCFFWIELEPGETFGRVAKWNPGFADATGLSPSELHYKRWEELFVPESRGALRKGKEKLFRKGAAAFRLTYRTTKQPHVEMKHYCFLSQHGGRPAMFVIARPTELVPAALESALADVKGDLGKKLRMVLAEKNISTIELSEMTGLSRGTISNLKSGKINRPHRFTIRVIADALGIDESELY